ncbi:MAG: electron transfer flavoprotein subunit alpha/FixB family protein, partial [Candidatus Kariarchaeaceae archaeon]
MSIGVFLESYQGTMIKAAKEAITAAKILADKSGKELFGIILDNEIDQVIELAGKLGISKVKAASGVSLYHSALYARFIANATKDADIIVLPATVWGREISPQVCNKLDATPVSDIIEIIDSNSFKRSIHGNKIHSTVKAEGKVVLTIRPSVFDIPEEGVGSADKEEITAETFDTDTVAKLAEILAATTGKIELTEADVIVSGGRGIGGPEKFSLIENLADVLGAAVGASRAVVDAGWRPHADQVGQTGKFVSPKVYIAAG